LGLTKKYQTCLQAVLCQSEGSDFLKKLNKATMIAFPVCGALSKPKWEQYQ